jgi:hypothetical protein
VVPQLPRSALHGHKPPGGWRDASAVGSYEVLDTLSAEDSATLSALMNVPWPDQLEFVNADWFLVVLPPPCRQLPPAIVFGSTRSIRRPAATCRTASSPPSASRLCSSSS